MKSSHPARHVRPTQSKNWGAYGRWRAAGDNDRICDSADAHSKKSGVLLEQTRQHQSSKFQQPTKQQSSSLRRSICQTASSKEPRVSGLAPATTAYDVQQFKSQREIEFNVLPNANAAKRVERPTTMQVKIQTLPAVLQDAGQAQQLIAKAREFRQSIKRNRSHEDIIIKTKVQHELKLWQPIPKILYNYGTVFAYTVSVFNVARQWNGDQINPGNARNNGKKRSCKKMLAESMIGETRVTLKYQL